MDLNPLHHGLGCLSPQFFFSSLPKVTVGEFGTQITLSEGQFTSHFGSGQSDRKLSNPSTQCSAKPEKQKIDNG